MALFNYASREITLKVVYYGPGLSGKTTNLQYLHPILDKEKKSKLISLSTESDRTLFFDFMPVELGKVRDFSIRFQLYTVPGQVRYNATRKLVLKGADAVVFVADSQRDMREQNIESLQNMRDNLLANNLDPDNIPTLLQFNKRDLPNILSEEELNRDLNINEYPYISAIAIEGTGVTETFQLITKLLIKDISKRHKFSIPEKPAMPQEELIISDEPEKVEEILLQPETTKEEIPLPLHELPQTEGEIVRGWFEEVPRGTELPEIPIPQHEIEEEGMEMEERIIEESPEMEQEILKTVIPEKPYPEWDKLEKTLDNLTIMLSSLKEEVERLSKGLKEQRSEQILKRLSNSIEVFFSELIKEVKELKTRQNEVLKTIHELNLTLSKLKVKKHWLHLFRK